MRSAHRKREIYHKDRERATLMNRNAFIQMQGRTQGGGSVVSEPPPPPRPLPLLYHLRRVHLTSLLHRMHMATKRTSSILAIFSKRSKGNLFCDIISYITSALSFIAKPYVASRSIEQCGMCIYIEDTNDKQPVEKPALKSYGR